LAGIEVKLVENKLTVMQKGKRTEGVRTDSTTLKIVEPDNSQAQVERQIEKHINKIRSLVNKLRPSERQRYFNGLVAYLLNEPIDAATHASSKKPDQNKDYSALSYEDLMLIEELSIKMEQLYRTMDHDPS
jgi:hypothetical protein